MKKVGDKEVDKYNIKDADLCMRCDNVNVKPNGYGRKWYICKECTEELKRKMKHYDEYGLFIGVKKWNTQNKITAN